jgi:3-methyladenine DNA glycosylase AlkD
MYQEFRSELAARADDEYRSFSMRGIPCERPFIGVRIPEIRQLVNEIAPADYDEFLSETPVALEEVLARGFVIARLPYEEMLEKFDSQIAYLDNWCTVDTFCAALRKVVKGHKEDFYERKVERLLASGGEFPTRAGIVLLLDFYVEPDYLHLIYDRVERLATREEYYVKMAIAWLVAECFIKYPDETFTYLKHAGLDKWTFNKAISKIRDSYRVSDDIKEMVKKMRK